MLKYNICSWCKSYYRYNCHRINTDHVKFVYPLLKACKYFKESPDRIAIYKRRKQMKREQSIYPGKKRCGLCIYYNKGYRCKKKIVAGTNKWVSHNEKGCEHFKRDFKKMIKYVKRVDEFKIL